MPIILIRIGARSNRTLYALLKAYPQLHVETAGAWVHRGIEEVYERFGPGRMIFGSGFPYHPLGGATFHVAHARIPLEAKKLVAGGNLARLMENVRVGGAARVGGATKSASIVGGGAPVPAAGPLPLNYRKPCPIIDLHCHMGYYKNFQIPYNDVEGMLGSFDAAGIDVGVISSHAAISADYKFGNNVTADAVRRFPTRYIGYAVPNPNYPDEVVPELERCFATGLFKAIKIHPELIGDYPMGGPAYRPMWRWAAERELLVLFHTYFGGDRLDVIDRLASEYPSVTFLVGHCALDLGLERSTAMAERHDNVLLDICGPQRFQGAVEYLVHRVGAHKLAWGSDIPFNDTGVMLGGILHADIGDEDLEWLLWRTAATRLRLNLADYGLSQEAKPA